MNGGGILAGAAVMSIAPESVFVPERIGFYHEDKAVALGRLIATDGQREPIKVSRVDPKRHEGKEWRLVVGMHRHHGCLIEGIEVLALEVSGKPEDLADLEASENLHRRPLGPIERAKFTAALVQAAQERIARKHGNLKQQQLAVKRRWDRVKAGLDGAEEALRDDTEDTCAKFAHVYGWEESVGEALGMSRRTIHNDLALYRLLIEPFPDLIEALSKHPVVGENASQLKAICQVKDEGKRRKVIELLLEDRELSADEARVQAGIDRPDSAEAPPHQKFVNAVIGNLSRLTPALKKRHLPEFVRALGTDDVKRQLRDLLNEELGDA